MSKDSKIREDFGSRAEDFVIYVVFHSYLYYIFLRSVSHYIVSYSLSDFSRENDDFLVSNILNRRILSISTISLQDFRRTYERMKNNIRRHGLPLFYSKAVPEEFGGEGKDPSHQASVNILLELLDRIGDRSPDPESLFKEVCRSISKHIVESEKRQKEKRESERNEDVIVGFKDLSLVVGLYLEDYPIYPEFEGFSWIKESSRLLSRVIDTYLLIRRKYPIDDPLPREVIDKFSSSIDDLISYMIKDLYDGDFSPKAVSNLVKSFPKISVEWLSAKDPREGKEDEEGREIYKIYEDSFKDEESVIPVRDKKGERGRYRNIPFSFLSLISSKDWMRKEHGDRFFLSRVEELLDKNRRGVIYRLNFLERFDDSKEIISQVFRAIAFTNFSYFFFVTYINGPTSNYVKFEDLYASDGPDFDAIEKDYGQETFTSGFEAFDSSFLVEEIDSFVEELDKFVGLNKEEKEGLFRGMSRDFSSALTYTLEPQGLKDYNLYDHLLDFADPPKNPFGRKKISALVFSSDPVKSPSLKKEAILSFRLIKKRSLDKEGHFISPFAYVTESLKNPLVFFSKYKKYFCELNEFYRSSVFIRGIFDKSVKSYKKVEMRNISPSDYVFGVVAFDYESPYSYYGVFTEKLEEFLNSGDKYVEMTRRYISLVTKMVVMVFYPKEGSEAPLILASLPEWTKVVQPFRGVVEPMVRPGSCGEKLSEVKIANNLFKGEVVENLDRYLGENYKDISPIKVQFFDLGSGQQVLQTSFINPFSRDGMRDLVFSEVYGKTSYATGSSSSHSTGKEEKLDKFSPFRFLGRTTFYLNPGVTKSFKLFEWPFVALDLSYSRRDLGLDRKEAHNMFVNSPNLWKHFVDSLGKVYESLDTNEVLGGWASEETSTAQDFVHKMVEGAYPAGGERAQAISLYGHLPYDLCFYGKDGKLTIKVYGEEGPFNSLLERNEKLSKSIFYRLREDPKIKEEIIKIPGSFPPLVRVSVLEELVPIDFALVNVLPAEGYYEYLPALLFSGIYLRKNDVKTGVSTKKKDISPNYDSKENLSIRALEKTSLSYKSDGAPYKNIIKYLSSEGEELEKDIRKEVYRIMFGWEGDDTTPKFGPLVSHLRFFFTITKRILQSHLEEYEKTKDKKKLIDKIKSMGINEFGMSSYISLLILFYDKKEGTSVSKVFPILHLPKECWEDLGLNEILGVRRKE